MKYAVMSLKCPSEIIFEFHGVKISFQYDPLDLCDKRDKLGSLA